MEFDYEKHGLKKGDYLLTLKTFEEPKKLGLVLVRNSNDDGNSFKLIKNVPGEYILDSRGQQFHRVPKGMLYARDIGDSNAEDFVPSFTSVGVRIVSDRVQALSASRFPVDKVNYSNDPT